MTEATHGQGLKEGTALKAMNKNTFQNWQDVSQD
jgi:hypothetical protein